MGAVSIHTQSETLCVNTLETKQDVENAKQGQIVKNVRVVMCARCVHCYKAQPIGEWFLGVGSGFGQGRDPNPGTCRGLGPHLPRLPETRSITASGAHTGGCNTFESVFSELSVLRRGVIEKLKSFTLPRREGGGTPGGATLLKSTRYS